MNHLLSSHVCLALFAAICLSPSHADAWQGRKCNKNFVPLLDVIDAARESGQLKKSGTVGGRGGGNFETIPVQPSLLVGFEYTTSTLYGGHLTIKSLRPIFCGRDGESIGKWHGVPHGKVQRIKAKNGYVVAGVVAKSGHRVDGMRVNFVQIKKGRVMREETYQSEWIGGRGGGAETQCASDGHPVVGIYGRQGRDLDALGFVLLAVR